MTSPGASSVPANRLPIITQWAPAASAFATSPEYLMPPSAITVVPMRSSALAQSLMAVTWGTPTPATTRVVQIDPGPMPTFTTSAPAFASATAASAVAMLPAVGGAVGGGGRGAAAAAGAGRGGPGAGAT